MQLLGFPDLDASFSRGESLLDQTHYRGPAQSIAIPICFQWRPLRVLPRDDLHSSFWDWSLQKDSQATKERHYFVHTIKMPALWVLSRQIVQQIGEGRTDCQNVCSVIEKYCLHTFSIQAISQQTMASRDKMHHKGWIPAASRTNVMLVPWGAQEGHQLH